MEIWRSNMYVSGRQMHLPVLFGYGKQETQEAASTHTAAVTAVASDRLGGRDLTL